MRSRIKCLWHAEQTESLVRRKNDWRCYGACNRSYTHKEVEERLGRPLEYVYDEEDEYKEDLEEKFGYIDSLPKREIRGLLLPEDSGGYYLTWSDRTYYKYRVRDGKSKYLSPKGHRPSLFWARQGSLNRLWLVEGELNALSIARAFEPDSVASPGSATNFNSVNLAKYLTEFKKYSSVVVILDNDAAGMKGLIEAKAAFLYKLPFVKYLLISPDCNDLLQQKGPNGLREALLRADYK